MPELPEVETVCRGLSESLAGHPDITKVKFYRRDLRVPVPRGLEARLKGQRFHGIRRRAKYILLQSDHFTLINHLGMSGSWRIIKSGEDRGRRLKHDHCEIHFSDGQIWIYHDPRRFGLFDLTEPHAENESRWLKHLGPEPLNKSWNPQYLVNLSRGRLVPVKQFLMDQKVVVGVGNIYASEALFRAGIHPARPAGEVKAAEWKKLVTAVKAILKSSIKSGGTTLRDYRKSDGESGEFKTQLDVYDRAGEDCVLCGHSISLAMMGGRSTYWCTRCQK